MSTGQPNPNGPQSLASTTGAQCTLSAVLAETIKSYTYNKNDTLNAVLYDYYQDVCFLKATFSRHRMDTRGQLVASLPHVTYRNELEGDPDPKAIPQWHVDSRAELLALLETIDSAYGAFYLAFWEGAEYRPPFHVRFAQEFEADASGALTAKEEFMRNFKETPVAFTIPIVDLAAPRYGTASDSEGESIAEELTWAEEAADMIYVFVGKGEPEKK